MEDLIVASAHCSFLPVNHRGGWLHVQLFDKHGFTGWGEASHSGDDQRVRQLLQPILDSLNKHLGRDGLVDSLSRALPQDKCGRTAFSAIEQALTDLSCRQREVSVAENLGAMPVGRESSVAIYTNLNRMCQDRSAQTVAQAARQALAQGVDRLKFAPFDEVSVQALETVGADPWTLAEPGLKRLEALRDAAGDAAHLMVDCHWRFTVEALPVLERIARELDIEWLEDPVPDQTAPIADRLRDSTGAQIAGGEHLLSIDAFRRYVENSGVDTLIADVKHVGGIGALHQLARLAGQHGMKFAPHNPSGPISTAASAHVALANSNIELLEYPFGEVPWRSEFAKGETLSGGRLSVGGPGLGIELDFSVVSGDA